MDVRIGEVGTNNHGTKMQIIAYRGAKDIDVKFEDGYIKSNVAYSKFKDGKISNPYDHTLYGTGYLGEGSYMVTIDNNLTPQYKAWISLLKRCFDASYNLNHFAYRDCTVCNEWLNFQVFAKWYNENYYEINGQRMELDKDILCKGNKVYSPETCVFVPQTINNIFIKQCDKRGEYPIGVCYTHRYKKKFMSQCRDNCGNRVDLGHYETPDEAFCAYKSFKEKIIKDTANRYINQIPEKVYAALISYVVEITD
jgi:hypothetical protein